MTIHVVNDSDADVWDDFIGTLPASGPFHTRQWTECFRNERRTPLYLRLCSGGEPVGGIAGLVVEPPLGLLRRIDRRVLLFSGPALADMHAATIRDCMLALKRYAEDRGFTSLVSLGRDYPYAYDWGENKVHLQVMHEYIVDLSRTWKDVVSGMRKSIPEQTRKAERAGLTFHEHRDPSILPQLFSLLESTRLRRWRKSGIHFSPYYLPYLREESLRRLAASDIARFFVARSGAATLFVVLVFAFRRRAYALWSGCDDEGYRVRAPAFTWFHAMQALQAEGVRSLNLAGAGPESKLAFAKTSLGADRRICTGSVSAYLKGPARNALFQMFRPIVNAADMSSIVGTRKSTEV